MSMEHADREVDEDARQNFPKTPAPGMSMLGRARSTAGWALAVSSTIGTILMAAYEIGIERLPQEQTNAWILALIAILVYLVAKLPHLLGQEPGDYVSLCREVLFCMFNAGIAVVNVARAKPQPTIFIVLTAFFVAVTCIEIVMAMRLTSRSWNQSSMGHL